MISKEIEVVTKSLGELQYWSDEEQGYVEKFASGLYIIDALGNYVFFMTRDRKKAQSKCNEIYGDNKYTVRTTSDKKTKSRLESGGVSCHGTTSRRGMGSWLKKTI